jgi:hypothetical protein
MKLTFKDETESSSQCRITYWEDAKGKIYGETTWHGKVNGLDVVEHDYRWKGVIITKDREEFKSWLISIRFKKRKR